MTLASFAFMSTGVVRAKAAATWFGPVGLGAFAQASQVQVLVATLAGAGLATAARVVLARIPPEDDSGRLAWIFWLPVSAALLLVGAASIFGEYFARLVMGDANLTSVLLIALLGVPPAVGMQVAAGAAQAHGERARILLGAACSAIVGGAVVLLLMSSGSLRLGAYSLVAAPLSQLLCLICFVPTLRSRLLVRPRMPKVERRELFAIVGGSMMLALAAVLGDNIARIAVVRSSGLDAIGFYQPAALLSSQAMSLVLGALAATVMTRVNSSSDRARLASDLQAASRDAMLVVSAIGLAVAAARCVLIPLLFDRDLLGSEGVLVVALASEPLRALSWVAGAVLLPLGHRRAWLSVGLISVSSQLASALITAPELGVYALPLSSGIGAAAAAGSTWVFLRRTRIRLSWWVFIIPIASSSIMLGSASLFTPGLWRVDVPMTAVWLGYSCAVLVYARRSDGPLGLLLSNNRFRRRLER